MKKTKRKIKKNRHESSALRPIPMRERLSAYKAFLGIMWRANPWLAFLRATLIVIAAILQPVQVYVFALVIDAIGRGDLEAAPLLIGLTIGAYAVHRIANDIVHSWLDAWFTRSVLLRASDELFAHLARLPPEALIHPDVRRDIDFAREDLWRINSLPQWTEQFFRSIIQIFGAFALSFLAPWWVLGLVLGTALLQAWNAQGESRRDVWSATWNSYDGRRLEYTRYLFLTGDDFRELHLLGATGRVLKSFHEAANRILTRFRRVGIKSATSRGGLAVLQAFAYATIMIVLAPSAFADPSRLATLYISLNLFGLLGDSLGQLATAFGNLVADLTILARIRNLLTLPIESDAGISMPAKPLVIEFRDVSYRYRGAKKDAISHLHVTIREHEHLAVVGENGAGKSTFLRLLAGLDVPTGGAIFVNGKPLTAYKKSEWRRSFHLMLQDAKLFQDYLGDNLLYGQGSGKWRSAGLPLKRGLEVAGADAVVSEVPSGLGAFIGDWVAPPGVIPAKVSGGQTQRLLIARTLIRGGRILAFDEPTSAMDALAETAFFDRLHEVMQGKGIIYISHRFSTVRRANRILVFDNGRLIDDGSHDELLAKEGTYSKLYLEQAKWYS
ncbi:MAG: ABC transporter ATP-binding protein [Patescibacteria group bacterium]